MIYKQLTQRILLLFIFFLLVPNTIFGQVNNAKFERFNVEHGLPQSSVMCIYQDSYGFLWLGTTDGLCRYDGKTFLQFKHIPNDTTSLNNNSIHAIVEDSNGNLWIGTGGGWLSKYNRVLESFFSFKNIISDPIPTSSGNIISLAFNRQNSLWVGIKDHGLYIFNLKNNSFKKFSNNSLVKGSAPGNDINCILKTKSNGTWVGSENGLAIYDFDTNTFIKYETDPVSCLIEGDNGVIWVGTNKGLKKFDINLKSFVPIENFPINKAHLLNSWIFSITKVNDGAIIYGTLNDGLIKYYPEKNIVSQFKNDPHDKNSISSNRVISLLKTAQAYCG